MSQIQENCRKGWTDGQKDGKNNGQTEGHTLIRWTLLTTSMSLITDLLEMLVLILSEFKQIN